MPDSTVETLHVSLLNVQKNTIKQVSYSFETGILFISSVKNSLEIKRLVNKRAGQMLGLHDSKADVLYVLL